MLDMVQSIAEPIISDALQWAALAVLAGLGRFVPAFLRRRMEAVDRDAIERAADTAAALLFAAIRMHPAVGVADSAISGAGRALVRKMPGVVKRLAPTQDAIEDMIRARVQRRIDEALDRDRLAEALKQAGVDGVVR